MRGWVRACVRAEGLGLKTNSQYNLTYAVVPNKYTLLSFWVIVQLQCVVLSCRLTLL